MSAWTAKGFRGERSAAGRFRDVGPFRLETFATTAALWTWAIYCGDTHVEGSGLPGFTSEQDAQFSAERALRTILRDAIESLDFDPAGARKVQP